MDYTEKWGVDIEEAVRLALLDLKCSRDEVEVTVLEEPTKGFLGIGAKLAKVRVEKIKPVVEEKKPEPKAEKKEPKHKERKSKEKKTHEKKSQDSKEDKTVNLALDDVDKDSLKDVEDHEALTFLKDITEKMGLNLNFNAKAGDGIVYLEMNGQDSRTVIGKRGQTLDAIQYLTSLVVNKDKDKYVKVVVDAENYRAKRQKTLEQLANRLAAKVVKTKKYVRLEPMNPYERKVIHATLQKNPNITTRSEGEEPYRRVIIELKK
ncbi:MAG: RNA-binding cell elongation regulator Jag/EloR [Bacillota bacterium]|nr:protein jag [Clostridiales bacterium]MDD6764284.1 protein jag [Bacillota bacterium]MDY5606603.1 RNA-binding cell elongation regulator Jag/EloR [Lentihominibacter sp.]MCI7392295.1 protein jag [Clostridiales bacterium]MDD6980058.1 protein jag [Bacillota bacterium]